MSTSGESEKPAKPNVFQHKAVRWVSGVIGVIFMISGVRQVYHVFFPGLPSCTSDTTKATLVDIFKKKDIELGSLTNQKTLTDSSSEETCQADVATAAEAGTLFYRIYWQDKAAQVQITKVDTHPR